MRNFSRRSRTIGTAKQGRSQDNRLTIPDRRAGFGFYECLGKITRHEVVVNGHTFLIVTEALLGGYQHCCSVADVARMLMLIPAAHYGQLRLIVLRQPKRKEALLDAVWGRLIYSYEFGDYFGPAIILEAIRPGELLQWRRRMSLDAQQELRRLAADGHRIAHTPRHHQIELQFAAARCTQLYRTLPHEFGHYQHYREYCEQPDVLSGEGETGVGTTRYASLPDAEKEQYAHTYAERMRQQLTATGFIPFDPLP